RRALSGCFGMVEVEGTRHDMVITEGKAFAYGYEFPVLSCDDVAVIYHPPGFIAKHVDKKIGAFERHGALNDDFPFAQERLAHGEMTRTWVEDELDARSEEHTSELQSRENLV